MPFLSGVAYERNGSSRRVKDRAANSKTAVAPSYKIYQTYSWSRANTRAPAKMCRPIVRRRCPDSANENPSYNGTPPANILDHLADGNYVRAPRRHPCAIRLAFLIYLQSNVKGSSHSTKY